MRCLKKIWLYFFSREYFLLVFFWLALLFFLFSLGLFFAHLEIKSYFLGLLSGVITELFGIIISIFIVSHLIDKSQEIRQRKENISKINRVWVLLDIYFSEYFHAVYDAVFCEGTKKPKHRHSFEIPEGYLLNIHKNYKDLNSIKGYEKIISAEKKIIPKMESLFTNEYFLKDNNVTTHLQLIMHEGIQNNDKFWEKIKENDERDIFKYEVDMTPYILFRDSFKSYLTFRSDIQKMMDGLKVNGR